jgi:2-oxoglutarate ferredoxin oxidoreductase subunit beta
MTSEPTELDVSSDEKRKAKDYKGLVNPDWCAGCGDFGVLTCLMKAWAELEIQPHKIVTISGIGCSSNLPGYVNTYGMHTLHGRSLAVATGVQLANHELCVVATGGDGDGFGIGGNHFAHTARRNVNLTYVVMDNQIYGLTTGQISPTSAVGMKTKSTPHGNVELPINPLTSSMANGATFVARGFSGHARHLVDLIKQGIEHQGFSFIDVFSPCVTFNHENTYQFFKTRIKKLEDEDHDTSDWKAAMEKAMLWGDTIYTGVFLKNDDRPTLGQLEPVLDEGGPLSHRELALTDDQGSALLKDMM